MIVVDIDELTPCSGATFFRKNPLIIDVGCIKESRIYCSIFFKMTTLFQLAQQGNTYAAEISEKMGLTEDTQKSQSLSMAPEEEMSLYLTSSVRPVSVIFWALNNTG